MADHPNLRRRRIPMYVREGDVLHGDEAREAIAMRDAEEILREVLDDDGDDVIDDDDGDNDDDKLCLVRGEVLNQSYKWDTEKVETEQRKPWFKPVRTESGRTAECASSLAEVNALNVKVQGAKIETTIKATANASGMNVSALNADVTGIEIKAKAEATANVSGMNVSVLEAQVTGVEIGATAKAECNVTGLDVRAGCLSATGVSAKVSAEAKVSTGRAVDVGNLDVTGMGPVGASVNVDARTGFATGNVQAGFNCQTGVDVSNRVSMFNVDLTVGAPRLSLGLGLNIGVPFMGGGGARRRGTGGRRNANNSNDDDGGGTTGGSGPGTSESGNIGGGGNNPLSGNDGGNDGSGGQTGGNRPGTNSSGDQTGGGNSASGCSNDSGSGGGGGTGVSGHETSRSQSLRSGRNKEPSNNDSGGGGGLRGGRLGARRSGSLVSGEHDAPRSNDSSSNGGRGGMAGAKRGRKRSGPLGTGKPNAAGDSHNGNGESSEPKKQRLTDKYDQMVIDTVQKKLPDKVNQRNQSTRKNADLENLDREGIKQKLIRSLKPKVQESTPDSKGGSDNKGNASSHGGLLAGASSSGKMSTEADKEVSQTPVKKGKPFGANKNIHGFHTLGTTSDKPLKQLGENIVGFAN